MTISILAFGICKEFTKASKITIEVDEGLSVYGLKNDMESRYPQLTTLKSYMIAVNKQYAADDVILKFNDEIAIIPPVSGG